MAFDSTFHFVKSEKAFGIGSAEAGAACENPLEGSPALADFVEQ